MFDPRPLCCSSLTTAVGGIRIYKFCRFRSPYRGTNQRVGTIVYQLALPPSLSGVHEVFHVSILLKYTLNPSYVVDLGGIIVDIDGTFEEGPERILDSRDQVLRCKTVRLVKVL